MMDATASGPPPWTRVDLAAAVISPLLGVAPVVLVGLQWLLSWRHLGRMPVPSVDDPGAFGLPLSLLHAGSLVSMLALPAVWLAFPVFWWARHRRSRVGKILIVATFLLPLASIAILRADPLQITTWWLD